MTSCRQHRNWNEVGYMCLHLRQSRGCRDYGLAEYKECEPKFRGQPLLDTVTSDSDSANLQVQKHNRLHNKEGMIGMAKAAL